MKNIGSSFLPILILFLIFACKNSDDSVPTPDTTVASIEIIVPQNVFTIGIDLDVILEARAKNAAGEVLTNLTFTWSSSDETVASINTDGLLTLLAIGMTSISATVGNISGSLDIEVQSGPMPQVTIVTSQTDFMFGALTQSQFQAVVVDVNGQVVSDPEVQWGSLDESIISIDQEGNITAHVIGQTEVTATFETVTASLSVAVVPPDGEGDFNFESDGITLRATINLPEGNGPFPAVVLVHGSGTATRQTLQVYADILTNKGIAVFFYDKRGTGDSEGIFFEVGPSASGEQRIIQLGQDALAGLEFMRFHAQVEADHVGLFGFSQGGWVVPSATAQAEEVDFMVNIVGPVCTVGEENYYSSLTASGTSIASANAQVANYSGVHGYDPVPDLEQIDVPGLWVLGGQDQSIPSEVSMERLNLLIDAGKPFDIHLKPNGNHFLIDVNTGQQISYLSPPGGVVDWIMAVVN